MLTLYDYFRSSACFRVRIALNLKNIQYATIPVHLINDGGEQHSTMYQQLNPHHLVPTLLDDEKIITQSIAIIEYINDLYPNPPLLPMHPYEKALVRAFALSIAAEIHPLNNLRVLNYLKNDMQLSEEKKNAWYQHWTTKGLIALEKQIISYNKHRNFCFGDQPSLADICLVPQMFNAKRFNCDLSGCPTLVRIDEYCQQQPAFIKASPLEPVT